MQIFTDTEIEEILESYTRMKLKIFAEQEQLYGLFPSCTSKLSSDPKPSIKSDSTAHYGANLAEYNDSVKMRLAIACKKVRLIELVYETLTAEQREFVRVRYFERHTRQQTIKILGVSAGVVDSARRSVIDSVRRELVELNKCDEN